MELEPEIDRLYQVPLDAFVGARNALAAQLKSAGDKEGSARVKGLPRPSVAAWAANQAYWQARPEFDALAMATEALQQSQSGGEAGAPLREAMKTRREAQAALRARAEALLVAGGHGATAGTLGKVFDTLDALAAPSGRPVDVRPGRVARDLPPPGFEAIALAEVASASRPRTPRSEERAPETPSPEERDALQSREDALEDAKNALAEAERRLEVARREARESEATRSVAERRAEGARGELQEATRRLDRARERAGHLDAEESAARLEAEEKAAALESAEAVREAARRALRAFE